MIFRPASNRTASKTSSVFAQPGCLLFMDSMQHSQEALSAHQVVEQEAFNRLRDILFTENEKELKARQQEEERYKQDLSLKRAHENAMWTKMVAERNQEMDRNMVQKRKEHQIEMKKSKALLEKVNLELKEASGKLRQIKAEQAEWEEKAKGRELAESQTRTNWMNQMTELLRMKRKADDEPVESVQPQQKKQMMLPPPPRSPVPNSFQCQHCDTIVTLNDKQKARWRYRGPQRYCSAGCVSKANAKQQQQRRSNELNALLK